jgi:hypothetical protein
MRLSQKLAEHNVSPIVILDADNNRLAHWFS